MFPFLPPPMWTHVCLCWFSLSFRRKISATGQIFFRRIGKVCFWKAFLNQRHNEQTTRKCEMFECKILVSNLFILAAAPKFQQNHGETHFQKRFDRTLWRGEKMDSSFSDEDLAFIMLSKKRRVGFRLHPLLRYNRIWNILYWSHIHDAQWNLLSVVLWIWAIRF